MTRRQEVVRNIVAVLALLAVPVVISRCQASQFEARKKALLEETDSLRTVVAIREALHRESEKRVTALQIEKRAAQDSARRAIAEADRLRAQRRTIVPVASQPDAAPTVSDTLRAVESQLENCDAETLALRATIQQDSIALGKAAATEAERAGQLAGKDSSIVELKGVVHELTTQLAAADPPCRVLFMACPSRTQVAIGTAVLTAVLTLSLTR